MNAFPPIGKGKDSAMHIRVVGRFKYSIGRNVDLDSAIAVHPDVLQPADVEDTSLSKVLSQAHDDLLEVNPSKLVNHPRILLRILN